MINRFPMPAHLIAFKWRGLFLFIFLAAILGSLIAIVKIQYEIRYLESQYYDVMQQALKAREEWGRLMLEKTHLTSSIRVEQIARSRLHMTSEKDHYETVILPPQSAQVSEVESGQ